MLERVSVTCTRAMWEELDYLLQIQLLTLAMSWQSQQQDNRPGSAHFPWSSCAERDFCPWLQISSDHHALQPLCLILTLSSCPEAFRNLTATLYLYQVDKTWFPPKSPAEFWAPQNNGWLHYEAFKEVAAPELPCHRNRTIPNKIIFSGDIQIHISAGNQQFCPRKDMHI